MKASYYSFSVVSILLLSTLISLAASDQLGDFLQCLPNSTHSPSWPISQAIYTANNASFDSTLRSYINNRRFLTSSTPKPLAIVAALHESHVQATVRCAKSSGLQMRIRSGGHDYEGLSYVSSVPFVILDMFNLRSIEIDMSTETAWVQAGATLGEIYYNIANTSNVHAFPAGVCPTVGAGGHFSGGGYGTLMRKYGLSVDNIVDAQIVDVSGNILDRKAMGEDLFWAIRGGGGASFGVILSWKINLVRVPETVTVFRVPRTLEQGATHIVYRWQQVATKLDSNLFMRAMPQVVNGSVEGQKTIEIAFYALFLGRSDALLDMINKSFPELGLKPEDCKEMRWIESTVFWADFPNGTPIEVLLNRPQGAQIFYKNKSDFVKDVIPKEALKRIWKLMIKAEPIWMQWNAYGGRMSEISGTATPFPHRDGYLFKIQYNIGWDEGGNETTVRNINLIRKVHDAMTPYVTRDPREAFLNYRDLDIGSNPSNETNFEKAVIYGSKYFKHNFLRLVDVKTKFDPQNFFRNEQSIPPRPHH
ncbi:bifunctional hydroxyacyl-CoA dehydrogenase/enoyl-CoA hydratase fox2 [Turnera subulata]|uniref:Bifunctional hydroxyacyl-CoA dehydrogenase/enoyl-CoA hydratase fox2 n=1 Tax=Turnera subulata TaxID=218843 RepID=A0A9Q0FC85_9ROSI|nr:bifunctional hydroxyacyl-CoA dehydrogenase/enoyl-CoA hydratase fox2 [Turnera subulata]